MKKKHICIIITLVAVLIAAIFTMFLLVKVRPQLYHQLKGDIIAEYHLDHYGNVLTKGKYAPKSDEGDKRPEEMSLEVYVQAVRKLLE